MKQYFVLVLMLNVLAVNVDNCKAVDHVIEEEWVEPDAWGRKVTVERKTEYLNLKKDISNNKNVHNDVAFVYYKKLIKNLFERDKLQYNARIGRYCRSLVFHIMPTQLVELESVTDPRELDLMLQELILNAHSTSFCNNSSNGNLKSSLSFLGLILDIVKDLWQLLKTVEIQVTVIGSLCVVLAWYFYTRYGLLGVLTFVVLGSVVFGYYITYLECNRNLETEAQLELLENAPVQVGWLTKMSSWFSGSTTENQHTRQKLLKSHKIRLPFCRPDHVLLMYGNDIFLKQIQVLIEKCISTIESINNRLGFPLNVCAAAMVLYLIGFITKLTFKYILSPHAWLGIYHSTSNVHVKQSAAHLTAQQNEDRISGENLKALLHLMKNTHGHLLQDIKPNASGVQAVLEQLDAPVTATPNNTPTSSKSGSPQKSPEKSTLETKKDVSAETLENSASTNSDSIEKLQNTEKIS